MSELPELPPLNRRIRPVPAGGVDAAVATGRRRRNRVVGAAGGTATAAIAIVAIALAAPGARNESLQPADPTRGPDITAPAGQAATPTKSVATPGGLIPSLGPASPEPSAEPSPGAPASEGSTGAQPGTGRSAYTEAPKEVAAPATCRQPPSGQTGPIVYGGVTGCTSADGGPNQVKRGGRVSGTIDFCNAYGAQPASVTYNGGQEHEVLVTDGDGEVVYRFSSTVDFTQGAHRRTVGEGRCLVWTGVWDTRTTAGDLVPSGSYQVTISHRPSTINGYKVGPGEGGSVGFSVYVE
jgi:hypothetical protein